MDNIYWSLRRLRGDSSGGMSGIQSEHLQSWLAAVTYGVWSDTANWDRVVAILQTEFRYGMLPTECTLNIVFLILKGNEEFRGIGLVDICINVVN